ncbi:hypothetical protein PIB30_015186 [Stylosanthes scabra]|uniref:Uncharacterized protein n=1 Tax=Stylosanthes scabra TaxID=79078 RepID=A0ABU6U8J1_9FABA|nr:hypothetical protein [Stylosanthes scabra]
MSSSIQLTDSNARIGTRLIINLILAEPNRTGKSGNRTLYRFEQAKDRRGIRTGVTRIGPSESATLSHRRSHCRPVASVAPLSRPVPPRCGTQRRRATCSVVPVDPAAGCRSAFTSAGTVLPFYSPSSFFLYLPRHRASAAPVSAFIVVPVWHSKARRTIYSSV